MTHPTTETVLALRAQGLSYNQVAAHLGCTKGQVAGLVHRATSKLHASQKREAAVARLKRRIRKALEKLEAEVGTGPASAFLVEMSQRQRGAA